jgi:hypothetical protein
MKTRTVLSTLVASLGLVFATLPGQASALTIASNHITQAQIDGLHSGETSDDVVNTLGKPNDTTRWMDGSRSLVYQTYDTLQGTERVYVDLDSSGKMTSVEVLPLYD